MGKQKDAYQILIMTVFAAVLWFFTFATDILNFWLKISLSTSFLAITSIILSKPNKNQYKLSGKNIIIGVASAAILYGIFYIGNYLSGLVFDFSASQVGNIYAKSSGIPTFIIVLVLVFITSPAEEIFWRGFLQEKLMNKFGKLQGLVIGALIYGLVHIWSMNFMLVGAALVAGVFWGYLYYRYRNLSILIISHAIWTVTIFVVWPVR